ncbi:ENTH domain-containing protein [Mycena venus]|uniref:ENTH domain-containing protein n=1 Tax=Mycena venus TaxID=2733690 RepID=A0A8H6Z2Z3_9AGAR|nr:ENTH domain-containing protein [Mycena venus]
MLRKYLTGFTAPSSYDKVVQLACKPKATLPKAKYLDPIIAATWDSGALHEVCVALSSRFYDPNATVVFKALIVLHTMIRNGNREGVLRSGSETLQLSHVSTRNYDHTSPAHLQNYAAYLDSRIQVYRNLEHDVIRMQSDARATLAMNNMSPLRRGETRVGRKLRSMTVEEGLLRETRAVQRMVDALVACRFYLDDLEDPLVLTALKMLVQDLPILLEAENEGVLNLLERFFDMSHVDATEALTIYHNFCTTIELAIEYLGVARKQQFLLNVLIPNLKHPPISLGGALQEYLDDPAFEQNRIEYRINKDAARRGTWSWDSQPTHTRPSF